MISFSLDTSRYKLLQCLRMVLFPCTVFGGLSQAFCCSSLAWGVGVSSCRWVLWFLFSCLGSSTLGVLFFQGQALRSCASLHVSGTSFHDRRVLQGCDFFLLSYMACATSFCFVCRVLCVRFHFQHSFIQARLPAASVLGCGCLRRLKSAKPKC